MTRRVLLTANDSDVAPRFDTCQEVMIVDLDGSGAPRGNKTLVLAEPSAEDICLIVLAERVEAVICGGIEEEQYQFLTWKGVNVLEGVIGPVDDVLARYGQGALRSHDILRV